MEPGCTIAHALTLIGNFIPEYDQLLPHAYVYIQTLAEIAAYTKICCLTLVNENGHIHLTQVFKQRQWTIV